MPTIAEVQVMYREALTTNMEHIDREDSMKQDYIDAEVETLGLVLEAIPSSTRQDVLNMIVLWDDKDFQQGLPYVSKILPVAYPSEEADQLYAHFTVHVSIPVSRDLPSHVEDVKSDLGDWLLESQLGPRTGFEISEIVVVNDRKDP